MGDCYESSIRVDCSVSLLGRHTVQCHGMKWMGKVV